MNSIQLTGRLTKDPEVRELPSGAKVCDLRLAVDGMGRNNSVGYVDVAAYGAQGEAAGRVLNKGWLVAIDGRLEHREWTTGDDEKRSAISVVGQVEFLAAPKGSDEADPEPAMAGAGAGEVEPF